MPLVNFSNLDFDQVKTTLKDYLRANSKFTDYDFEGSNLSTIIDLLAYNTYITSYNANMVTNEVFIDSATLRENVVSLARNIGYLPRSRTASRASVSFFVDASNITPRPSTITLQPGPVAATSGSFGNQSYVFSICDPITRPVIDGIANFDDIVLYEGTLLKQNYTFTSQNPNQRFILPNIGVDTTLIKVKAGTTNQKFRYSYQDNLFDITSDSKVFYIQEVNDERYEIFFGDGVFGRKLQEGEEIDISYIVSNGEMANGVNQFTFSGRLTYIQNDGVHNVTNGISLLTTGSSGSGGEEIEGVDSIKKFAPRIYASQNRALTASDYESLIPAKIYPETESISVFGGEELVPPQYGKVFISIKPRFGDFLPNLVKEQIKLKLKKYSVAGIVPEILDLKYLYLEVDSKLYYNSNLVGNAEEVSTIVSNNAAKYADSSDLNKYGARFKYSKFLNILDQSQESITSNITTVQIRRDLRLVTNSFAEYSVGFGNAFYIKSMSGYNIKSSPIRVAGLDFDVYLSDVPDSNRETGSLFLFSVPSINSTSPSIIRRNVGFINYTKGIVTLNPINITSGKLKDGQAILEISACPKSNDVIGLQDLYLQLDISNSTFEPIVDEISSGLDPAASNYIVTSSYHNGSLVREGGAVTVTTTATGTSRTSTETTGTTTNSSINTGSTGATSSSSSSPSY